ncbi:MAG: hypothetical protein ACRDP4_14710, partial [Nocardioidaceae bacterium]
MAPSLLAGFGFAFVLIVIRVRGIDIVPDSVGLAAYALAMWRLASSRVFVAAATVAALAAAIGLLNFVPSLLPDPIAISAMLAYNTCVALAIILGAWGLRARARAAGEKIAAQLTSIVALAALGLAAFLIGWLTYPISHQAAGVIIGSGRLVNIVVMVWYVIFLVVTSPRD